MPNYLDRATRALVTQYGNEDDAINANEEPYPRREAAPKAFGALERLLDACAEAEARNRRGHTPMVTVHWIRKQITEALEADA